MITRDNTAIAEETGLPEGWEWSTLGDISEKPQYGWTTKANHDAGELKLLRTTDITSGRVDWSSVPYCTEEPEDVEKYLVESGDILISRAGSVGVSFLINNPERAVFASYLIRFRPKSGIDTKYFYYYLKSPAYWEAIGASKSGIAVPNVNASKLSQVPIPVAPLGQQKRIVAEIEKQFSRLDEAVANLKRVKANLKRYKAAVLKAAVEGRLVETEAELARREGRSYETGEQLLQRVLETRRSQWQGKGKYKEPAAPDTTNLPELPEGWVWANFERVAERVTVGHVGSMKDEYVEEGIPFLRSQNVRANRYDPEGLKFISAEFHRQLAKSTLRPGDIVVVRSGSVGVSCVIPDHLGEANCSDLVIIKNPQAVLPDFGAYYMNSVVETRVAAGKVGVALTHFNTQSVAELPLPVPPMAEQNRIVAEVERRLSILGETEAQADANLKRGDSLRQSILEKAFSGQLIPEDPNAEPASVFLERIHVEKNLEQTKRARKAPVAKRDPKEVTVADLIEALKGASDWISAQEAFRRCGVGSGADTDAIERLYAELRDYVRPGIVEVERRGEEDWLRVSPDKEA